jgi:hypothetical protein
MNAITAQLSSPWIAPLCRSHTASNAPGPRADEMAQTRKRSTPPLRLIPGIGREAKACDCEPRTPRTAILRPTTAIPSGRSLTRYLLLSLHTSGADCGSAGGRGCLWTSPAPEPKRTTTWADSFEFTSVVPDMIEVDDSRRTEQHSGFETARGAGVSKPKPLL